VTLACQCDTSLPSPSVSTTMRSSGVRHTVGDMLDGLVLVARGVFIREGT
jgi:hypothetical protein